MDAGVVGVLPGRVGIRVAAEHRILVAFGHERLVREDESVVRAASHDIEPPIDPCLLLLDGVTVGVTIGVDVPVGKAALWGLLFCVAHVSSMRKRALLPRRP